MRTHPDCSASYVLAWGYVTKLQQQTVQHVSLNVEQQLFPCFLSRLLVFALAFFAAAGSAVLHV